MDTVIHHEQGGKKYNRFNEQIICCKLCDGPTTMLGTKLCDRCWVLESAVKADPELTTKILNCLCGDYQCHECPR